MKTISINIYENNFDKYIDIGIKDEISSFLKKNKSSVSCTLWGHGGVGKTATIQSICEDFMNSKKRVFDYILFISAKDRKYNFTSSTVENIDDHISTFDDFINVINNVIFDVNDNNSERLVQFDGKLLLVVDDFETFSTTEKKLITNFVGELNINHHKVVFTTRSSTVIGKEFQTNELTKEKTIDFLLQVIANENITCGNLSKEMIKGNKSKIFTITSGRPIFIYQLAFIIGRRGVTDAIKYDINKSASAVDFLYGRINDYLSEDARLAFAVLSLFVNTSDLTNVLIKVRFALNMDSKNDQFISAIDELVKLKIIELDEENTIFKVYSEEILNIMSDKFEGLPSSLKGGVVQRSNQVNKDRTSDIDYSLLTSANAKRLSKNFKEVADSYRHIMNRDSANGDIKLQATLNFTSYLNERGDIASRNEALDFFQTNSQHFVVSDDNPKEDSIRLAHYTRMWAVFSWANGTDEQKSRAVDILMQHLARDNDFSEEVNLEISGLALQYRSILLTNEWQNLKNSLKYGEIALDRYNNLRGEQKIECKNIHIKIGNKLFNHARNISFKRLSKNTKHIIITSFYNYVDVLARIEMYDEGVEVCKFVLQHGPSNFESMFKKKLSWVNSLDRNDNKPGNK